MDVDLTLINCESFRIFILKKYLEAGLLKKSKLAWFYLLRRIGKISISRFKKQCFFILKGMKRSELEMLGARFSKNVLLKYVRPGAYITLKKHKSNGLPIYLVSASPQFYVKSLSNQLGLFGSFATEFKYNKEGKFTGDFDGSECIAEEKLLRLKYFCERMGIDLNSSVFYTDSYKDMPLLISVGVPIAVCPDKQLKKICKQKGWAIEYW